MSVDQAVMEKLQKILRLAANKAATQGEVEAAMARAKEIAMNHGIELASVDITDPNAKAKGIEVVNDSQLKLGVAFWRKYHVWICHVIQTVFGVRIITRRHRDGSRERCTHIWIIGEVTDVAIAKAVFSWLEDLYPKSYRQAVNSYQVPVDNASSQHGYFQGLSHGILEANKREEERIKHQQPGVGEKWAIVVRRKEDAIAERCKADFPHLQTKQSRARSMSAAAAAVGYAKGRSINLNQIGGSRPSAGHLN